MKKFLFILFLAAAACGKHESQSSGYTKPNETKTGLDCADPAACMKEAIDTENRAEFEKILAGSGPDLVVEHGQTLVIYATKKNVPVFVFILVGKGANLELKDEEGFTAMDYAVKGELVRIQLLLNPAQQAQMQKDLMAAVEANKVSTVSSLLKNGADPNFVGDSGETPLTTAITKKSKGIFNLLAKWKDPGFQLTRTNLNLANTAGFTPLQLAEQKGLPDYMETLKEEMNKEPS